MTEPMAPRVLLGVPITFDCAGQPRGLSAALDVTVVRGSLQALTRDSFLIWY